MRRARRPQAGDLQRILAGLLPSPVSVKASDGPAPDAVLAGYQDAEGRYLAVLAGDLHFSAASGGALGMISPDAVAEIEKDGELPANILENYREVANVLASILCGEGWAHVRLTDVHAPGREAPEAMRALIEGKARVSGFEVTFARYGVGRASFHLA